jgi:rhodanese-related sulfurtransferase
MESEETLLIDARTTEEYSQGHIPGAVNLPVYEFDSVYPRIEGLFGEGKTIVAYCSSVTCIDSPLLAKKLHNKGYREIFVYRGGFKEWCELNNPVENPQETGQE